MRKRLYLVFIWLLFSTNSFCQCNNNIIKNGSFELDSIGEAITSQFWYAPIGSPDLDNADDDWPQINDQKWDGQVLESEDGGNWQNISYIDLNFGLEVFEGLGQRVTFEKCIPHILEFEFTSQIIETFRTRNGHSAVDVYLDNRLLHTTNIDTSVFTWEKVQIIFTPTNKSAKLEFYVNSSLNYEGIRILKYVGIDGVCLRPVKMGMFCEP